MVEQVYWVAIAVLVVLLYLSSSSAAATEDRLEKRIASLEKKHREALEKRYNAGFRSGKEAGRTEALLDVEDYVDEAEDLRERAAKDLEYQRWVNTQLWEEVSEVGRQRIWRVLHPEQRNGNGHRDEDIPEWALEADDNRYGN